MNFKPKVTVAICVKNAEATVKEAIESILDQDYPHELMELVVVDGYSTDKTILIIREALSKSTIKYRVFYENDGLGHARQISVDNANGDYIVWVDGDMVVNNDYLRKQVEFMEQNPTVGIAEGRFTLRSNCNLIAALENIDWVTGDYRKRQSSDQDPKRNCCAGSICRVNAIRQVGGFDAQIIGAGEDLDMAYKINKAGWSIHFGVDASLQHRGKETWKDLWNENSWYGYGSHYILHKYKEKIHASSLAEGLQHFLVAYRLTRRKIVFLLPAFYLFKKVAWFFGFTRAHMDGYGHQYMASLTNEKTIH